MRRFGVRIPTGSREEAWLLKQLGFFVLDTSIQQRFHQRVELPLDVGHAFAGQVMEIEEGGVGQGVPSHMPVSYTHLRAHET